MSKISILFGLAKMLHKPLFLLSLLFVFPGFASGAAPKECIEKISPDLVKLLGGKFPAFRIPHLTDLDQQSIRFDLDNGGDGCYAVANADFDGDSQQDVAILLVSTTKDPQKEPQLIVALRRGNTWKIHKLPTFCETIQFCYVEPEKAGTYLRTQVAEDPITRKNERSKLTSRHMSVRSGTLESTGIVYVYSNGRWLFVWVSD